MTDDPDSQCGYLGGEYQILVREPYWYVGVTPGIGCTDCTLEVTGRFASEVLGSHGLLFGITAEWDTYLFQVSSNQLYSLYKLTGESWEALEDWTESPHINAGQATNHLRVVRQGSDIELYVNGRHLTTVSDSTFLGLLGVGLTASAYESVPVDVRFDDFTIFPAETTSEVGTRGPAASIARHGQEAWPVPLR